MLKSKLLHPEILAALAKMGHGSKLLLADANYPVATETPATAARVFLNLSPGVVGVVETLDAIVSAVPVESAVFISPPDGAPQEVHEEFKKLLPEGVEIAVKKRFEFYAEAKVPSLALAIATGERRRFANVILTIGVVK